MFESTKYISLHVNRMNPKHFLSPTLQSSKCNKRNHFHIHFGRRKNDHWLIKMYSVWNLMTDMTWLDWTCLDVTGLIRCEGTLTGALGFFLVGKYMPTPYWDARGIECRAQKHDVYSRIIQCTSHKGNLTEETLPLRLKILQPSNI
jgi:hypothetical protein